VLSLLAAAGDLPDWTTLVVTPTAIIGLLVTQVFRVGKQVDDEIKRLREAHDRELASANTRADAAETRAKDEAERAERSNERERATLAGVLPALETYTRMVDRMIDVPAGRSSR
jgi:hypothetical protein